MAKEKQYITITTPFIKLDNFLKFAGISVTGGNAKRMVEEGLVKVEGEVCLMRGKKLRPGMCVQVGEQELEVKGED